MRQPSTLFAILAMLFLLAGCAQEGGAAEGQPVASVTVVSEVSPEATLAPTPEPTLELTPEPTPEPTEAPAAGEPVDPVVLLPEAVGEHPWWISTVWYEVFVRSFYDSDGDGVGDLPGLIEKLDYLNDGDPATTTDLGVTGLWLMPIFESPSYHGYDVVDYFQVDEDYGTNEDFQRLVEEAHARGMRVIIDMVLNHTSREHPWFEAALSGDPEFEPYYRFATGEQPRQFAPWGGSNIWYPAGADRYYYALYWEGMPDLNYETPAVTEQMYEVSRYWLEEMGADGFRLDGVAHLMEEGRQVKNTSLTHEWLADYQTFIKEINPEAVLVGEVWYPSNEIAPYIAEGELDLAFEFTIATNLLAGAEDRTAGPFRIGYGLARTLYPPLRFAPFITNHDINRAYSQLDEDESAMKVASAVLLTGPGSPFLYYGEEVGMTGVKPDEDIRRPLPWSAEEDGGFTSGRPWRALPEGYEERNIAAMDEDRDSLLNHYRRFIHLRNAHQALRIGEYQVLDSSTSDIFSFIRQSADETVLVLHNVTGEVVSGYALDSDEPVEVGADTPVELLRGGEAAPVMLDAEGRIEAYTPIESLEPYQSYVIQLRP